MSIIGAIRDGMGKSTVSEILAKPEKFKAELGNFGIFVEGGSLRYERHPKVFFSNPLGARTGAVIDTEQAPEPSFLESALEDAPEAIVRPESPENDLSYYLPSVLLMRLNSSSKRFNVFSLSLDSIASRSRKSTSAGRP